MQVKLCFVEKNFEISLYTCTVIQPELKTCFVPEPVLGIRPFIFFRPNSSHNLNLELSKQES